MGNLNFQDEQNENPQENQPDSTSRKSARDEDAYIDDPTSNSRLLWIIIIVILVAGIGGGLYMLNRAGYLKFPAKHKTEVTKLTAPPPSAPTPTAKVQAPKPATTVASQPGSFALQVSAFKTRGQAERYVASLKKKGIDGRIVAGEASNGNQWYRVFAGSFNTKLKAIAAVENMKKKVGTDVWVVPAQ